MQPLTAIGCPARHRPMCGHSPMCFDPEEPCLALPCSAGVKFGPCFNPGKAGLVQGCVTDAAILVVLVTHLLCD
jgi:hypothetical protein